jgi:hypothetical protein
VRPCFVKDVELLKRKPTILVLHFLFLCDFIWILQGTGSIRKETKNLSVRTALETFHSSQQCPWFAFKPLERFLTTQCGPWPRLSVGIAGFRWGGGRNRWGEGTGGSKTHLGFNLCPELGQKHDWWARPAEQGGGGHGCSDSDEDRGGAGQQVSRELVGPMKRTEFPQTETRLSAPPW